MIKRRDFDVQGYIERTQGGPCFVCDMLSGNNPHYLIYEDAIAVAFLNKYPTLYGYTLVAPRKHREHVTKDFTRTEFLALQGIIYSVSEAIQKVVLTERLYILSLGSQQGNRHVHWRLAPLPPGVQYEAQQIEALRMENGVLEISQEEMADLAKKIRDAMDI